MILETFPALRRPGLRHGFSTRSHHAREELDDAIVQAFVAAGFPMRRMAAGAQIHGGAVARVDAPSVGRMAGVDALITNLCDLPLTVRVADCGPVFFFDPVRRAIGLAHSGRAGTELNIVGATIAQMEAEFGSNPADLIVQLGPCIRPPHYPIDFAGEIGRQARASGVILHFIDDGRCTAANLGIAITLTGRRKAQTGRMWGVLVLASPAGKPALNSMLRRRTLSSRCAICGRADRLFLSSRSSRLPESPSA